MKLWIQNPWRDAFYVVLLLAALFLVRGCEPPAPVGVQLDSFPKESFYGRVSEVREDSIELTLVVQPQQTRFVLEGEPKAILKGDYVKFSITGNRAQLEKREFAIRKVTWITDP